jgi:hypothetical protein
VSRGVARAWVGTTVLLVVAAMGCDTPAPQRPAPPSARQDTPPTEAAISQAALAALAAAPWDADPSGWGSLCSATAPCDTLVLDPRVVALPAQAPAFFVPDRRDAAATLSAYALTLAGVPGRQVRLGAWRECSSRRDLPAWSKGRVACVAMGIAGVESARSDAITFALMVATPAKGLSWPRVRATRPRESWRGRLISNAGE